MRIYIRNICKNYLHNLVWTYIWDLWGALFTSARTLVDGEDWRGRRSSMQRWGCMAWRAGGFAWCLSHGLHKCTETTPAPIIWFPHTEVAFTDEKLISKHTRNKWVLARLFNLICYNFLFDDWCWGCPTDSYINARLFEFFNLETK